MAPVGQIRAEGRAKGRNDLARPHFMWCGIRFGVRRDLSAARAAPLAPRARSARAIPCKAWLFDRTDDERRQRAPSYVLRPFRPTIGRALDRV
jgi:hypothetical protein